MSDNSKNFIKQRSFEIAWAVFRVAALVRHPKLKIELENTAIDFLSQLNDLRCRSIEILEGLVKLAEAINEINPINAKVLYREMENLQITIQTANGKRQTATQGVEIESIFSKPPMIIDNESKRQTANGNPNGKRQEQTESGKLYLERKPLILKAIQESSKNLQFKDLIEILPDICERTVRNDIQRLCDEGIVERIGGGGPHSYYKFISH
ncbi:MAG: DeoR family transcriptional regulator [Patescibacteria group bacterium]